MSVASLQPPPAVLPGDGVSIVAPASSPEPATLEAAIAGLTAAGFCPKTYRDLCSPVGYLSGADDDRAAELNEAFTDPDTTVVLAARGGYGVGRILDRIDFGLLSARPKVVCGYSDITALHAAVQRRCGLVSLHGPNLVDGWGDVSVDTLAERQAIHALLTHATQPGRELIADRSVAPQALVGGAAEGRLVGGNLAVLVSLVGTPWEPDFDGAILAIEDVGESAYRVDRLLNQLRTAGRLERVAGVVTGYFTGGDSAEAPSIEEVLAEYLTPLGVPVLAKGPFGHEHPNLPLPMGAAVRLDADAGSLVTRDPIVASRA
ncbi:MAG: LD-carboxypeptidase [Planctomycetota bacterium]